jgi:hypothetical protein
MRRSGEEVVEAHPRVLEGEELLQICGKSAPYPRQQRAIAGRRDVDTVGASCSA